LNILLTGGAGYIGSHTAVVLASAGHKVVLLDNFSNSSPEVIEHLEKILHSPIVFIEADVRDTDKLKQVLVEHQIEAVIHFAGLKAVGESVAKPVEYYANNIQGTISLLQAMSSANIKKLVFSSSATVYGNPQYLPIDEEHPLKATNPYGRSKLHIEEILSDVARSDKDWRINCLRYFNPVGAHESGFLGEKPLGIPNNLMPYIAQVAMGKLSKLNIYGKDYMTPDGSGIRDYIHVMDLAAGHEAALNYLMQHHGWDVVNLGTGNGYSVFELITAFNAVSGRSIPFAVIGRRSGDVAACIAKVDKAKNLFGWKAKKSLDEMCASTWLWQKNCTQEFD
jgi:UDP-glucose 4-epimerase